MKRVFIVHGWEGSPKEPMIAWLRTELESKGFEAHAPEMPNTEKPKIEEWIPYLNQKVQTPDNNTYFIGHSIGCQAILRYLETLSLEINVGGIVLIAPWMNLDKKTIEEEGEEVVEIAKPWMETPINWEEVGLHSDNFTCIFSDNDQYVPLSDKDIFEKNLGAKIIIENNKGHFNEEDGIVSLPLASDIILEMSR